MAKKYEMKYLYKFLIAYMIFQAYYLLAGPGGVFLEFFFAELKEAASQEKFSMLNLSCVIFLSFCNLNSILEYFIRSYLCGPDDLKECCFVLLNVHDILLLTTSCIYYRVLL